MEHLECDTHGASVFIWISSQEKKTYILFSEIILFGFYRFGVNNEISKARAYTQRCRHSYILYCLRTIIYWCGKMSSSNSQYTKKTMELYL